MANNSGPSRREAMRLKAEAEEARGRRNARILWVSLGAVALVVIVVLAMVIVPTLSSQTPTAAQIQPPNATENSGIEIVSRDVEPAADAPHVKLYEDPQCPGCAATENTYGDSVLQLIDQGEITAEVITAHFLDGNLGNDASERAAMAMAAADEVGRFREYHSIMFANQPTEGSGYTEQQLRVDIPTEAGIEGADLERFQELYDGQAFADFAEASDEQFVDDGITSTPTYMVGDTRLQFTDAAGQPAIQPTPDDLLRAITEANAS